MSRYAVGARLVPVVVWSCGQGAATPPESPAGTCLAVSSAMSRPALPIMGAIGDRRVHPGVCGTAEVGKWHAVA
jgi:hypothetical protein